MKEIRDCWRRRVGHGFVENVHENARAHEIRQRGPSAFQQPGIVVLYDDVVVGEYTDDLMVEDQFIVEIKVVAALSASSGDGKPLSLLISLGRPKDEIRRITAQI